MKITEVRNNLFGLEDLKGLIEENTFNEKSIFGGRGRAGISWANFFKEYSPDLDFLKALNLPTVPNYPLSPEDYEEAKNLIANSPFAKFREFTDADIDEILNNIPRVFNRESGPWYNYDTARGNFLRAIKVSNNGIDIVKTIYDNGCNSLLSPEILKSGNENDIRRYFQKISDLSYNAIKYMQENQTILGDIRKISSLNIGNVYDTYSMFLYFIYFSFVAKSGLHGINVLKNSIPPEFREYVKNEEERLHSLLYGKEYSLVDDNETDNLKKIKKADYLQYSVLNDIGMNYGDLITSSNLEILKNTYFDSEDKVNEFFQKINSGQIDWGDIKNSSIGTVGGVLMTAAYILSFDISKNIEELTNTIRPFIAVTPSIKPIYQMVYYVKYKRDFAGGNFNNIIENWGDRLIKEFNAASYSVSLIIELFDLFTEVNTNTITYVVKNILGLNETEKTLYERKFKFDVGKKSTIKTILTEFASLGLAKHSTFYSLTPFERFIDMMNSANKLVDKNLSSGLYGGDDYLVISNMFKPLSEIYKEDTDSDQKIRSYKKNAEKVYGEDLIFGQLVSYVEDSHDRMQNEIYSFLLANLPNGYNNTWEYNRTKKIDKAFGDQSIDILYTTYNGDLENPNWFDLAKEQNDKVLSIEYQGEGHCRPSFIKPADESIDENDGVIYWWTKIKLEFLKKFKDELTKYQEKSLRRKDLVSDKLVSTNLKEVYESIFEMLVGKPFLEVYNIFNPFKITLDEFKRKTHLNEIADVLPDEYIKATSPEHEVVQTIYALLLQYNGIHYSKNTGIPNGFKFVKAYDEAMKQRTISLLKMYPKKELGYEISFLGSPNRFYAEIEAMIRRITDERKSNVIKQRGWAGLYILPPSENNTVSKEDIEFTQKLANPSSFVFLWDEAEKNNILASIMNYLGKPKEQEEETTKESLFESIIRELFSDNNFQLN